MNTPRLTTFTVGIFLSLLSISCRKEKTSWDAEITVPVVQSELSLEQLIRESSFEVDPDSSLRLVIEKNLINTSIEEIFSFPDTSEAIGSSLQTLDLPDDSVAQSLSLGQIGTAAGFGGLLSALNGSSFSLPAFNNVNTAPIDVDKSDVFESIDLESGKMEITITNNLPVNIANVDLELRNDASFGGAVIGNTSFTNIGTGQTQSNIVPLDGKTIFALMDAELQTLSTDASIGPVLIDTSNAVIAKIKIFDLKPSSATAIWPDQDLIDTTSLSTIPSTHEMKIKSMLVKTGDVELEVVSSLQDSMFITYTVPNLNKNGQIFQAFAAVPPAPVGSTASVTQVFDFSGYEFVFNGYGVEKTLGYDLNGNGTFPDQDTVNAYVQNIKVKMQYTGQMKTISKSDTVFLRAKVKNVVPEAAFGYLGYDTLRMGPSTIELDQFKGYLGGDFKLEDVDINFVVNNGIGAGSDFQIVSMSGTNTVSGKKVNLSGAVVGNKHSIQSATLSGNPASPVNIVTSSVSINPANSNATDFISNLPNQISFELNSILNSDIPVPTVDQVVNTNPSHNFLYGSDGLQADLNIEIPMSMIADSLRLTDTLDFTYDFTEVTSNDLDLTLVVENTFGFEAGIYLSSVDGSTLFLENGTIEKADIDPLTNKASAAKTSIVHFTLTQTQLSKLQSDGKIVATVRLHNYDVNEAGAKFNKVYTTDKMNIKVVAGTLKRFEF